MKQAGDYTDNDYLANYNPANDNPANDNPANDNARTPGTEGIILAAGLSSRAGAFKMTLDIGGKTVLERCIESMRAFCSRLIIVGGYRASDILPIVGRYSGAELVLNENYRDGMFSSVKKGIEQLRGNRFFLTPGDYPLICCDVYEKMLNIDADIVIPSFEGKTGHPVLVKSSFAAEILNDPGYGSLKDFIDVRGFKSIEVQDEGILADVDTMQDYCCVYRKLMKSGAV